MKIILCEQLEKIGEGRLLFFGDELHAALSSHKKLLTLSGRQKNEILVAGAFVVDERGILFEGRGSEGLEIEARDVTQMESFLKELPDAPNKRIVRLK